MNKKGFTLVELLAALGILALIMGIAAVTYTSIVDSSKTRAFKAYEKTMYGQAMELLVESITDTTRPSLIPRNGQSIRLSLSDLQIDPFINPRNKNDSCPTSYVLVTREDNDSSGAHVDAFKYKVCLICTESDYNVTGEDCLMIPEE